MNGVSIGKLRHRVTLQYDAARSADGDTESQDASGEHLPDMQTLAERWAHVEPLSGREFFAARQYLAQVTHRVVLRYLAGVTPRTVVLFEGREFDVEAVRDWEERGRWLELLCTERP